MVNFYYRGLLQEFNILGKYLIKYLKEILLDLGGSKFVEFCEIFFSICFIVFIQLCFLEVVFYNFVK